MVLPASPRRAAHRTASALAAWTVAVLALHAVVLGAIGRGLPSPASALAEPARPPWEVIGRLELADPVPAGPAAPAPGRLQAASPAPPAALWVPVPPRPAPAPQRHKPERELLVPASPAPKLPELLTLPESAPPSPQPVPPVPDDPSRPESLAQAPVETPAPPPDPQPASLPAPAAGSPPTAETGAPATPQPPPAFFPMPGPVVAGSVPGAPAFEWPPSTRVSYSLTGNYRGEIQGQAQVEWLLDADRYEVHLEVIVGVRLAPLMSRRMSSRGVITPRGLAPQRYDERTRVAFRDPRLAEVRLGPAFVTLADGRSLPAPVNVQDTASQFIQLAYRFATEPGLGTPGGTVQLPLALPRRVDVWTYDVVGEERLVTPFGAVDAVHLRPRPPSQAGDVLTAEIWFAPRLRYLPVRIRIQQGADTFIDLLIERLPDVLAPELAAPDADLNPAVSR